MTNSIFGNYLFANLLSSIECFCVLPAWNQNNTLISVLLTAIYLLTLTFNLYSYYFIVAYDHKLQFFSIMQRTPKKITKGN